MSGRNRRAEFRRQARRPSAHHRPELDAEAVVVDMADTAVIAGWCDGSSDALEEAKRETHDALLRMLGQNRKSGVQWRIYESAEGLDVLDRMIALEYEQPDPHGNAQALLVHYRTLRGKLREYGGLLVLALADGTPPKPRRLRAV